MRPVLVPGLPVLWRDRTTLQLGLHPDRAVVLGGVGTADAATLRRLDGAHDLDLLYKEAADRGGDPAGVDRLLRLLGDASVLVPPPSHDPAAGAWVAVQGAGRLGCAIAGLLAASGVGCVTVEDAGVVRADDVGVGAASARDLGRRRDAVALARVRGVARPARLDAVAADASSSAAADPAEPALPDLTVLAPAERFGRAAAQRAGQDGATHLVVLVAADVATVGPLVVPGRSSCLRCHDLHRTDRDPQWPQVVGQLEAGRHGFADPLVVMATAVLATAEVLCWLRTGRAGSLDGTLALDTAGGPVERRRWTFHPACGCTWDGPGDAGG